jgi:uncharacterized membrane protein YczE
MTDPQQRRAMPAAVTEALTFYREHPVVLIVTVVLSILLGTAVLGDGGVGIGEIVAVTGAGLIAGMIYPPSHNLRTP